MLSIGAFAKISKVTPNTLRYYDEIGLIKPAEVDSDTGYRYYDVSQLQTILLINKLKYYHLSLEEISEILQNPDDNELLLAQLSQKHQTMHQQLHQLSYMLNQMEQDIHNLERGIHIMSNLDKIQVQLIETEPLNILFIHQQMSTRDYGLYLSKLYSTVQQKSLTVTGPPISIFYHEEEFNPDCFDNELAVPVKETVEGTRLLPGGLCAHVTLHGPYTELTAAYAKLQQWIEKEGYSPASEPYEFYVTDPNNTPPEENITEIYFPIRK